MPGLFRNLRTSLETLVSSKPSLKAPKTAVKNLTAPRQHSNLQIFKGISDEYLMKIVEQVRIEGFHVESLVIFSYGNLKPSESIFAIEQWAKKNGLRVGINHEHGICFFDSL